MGHDTPEDAPRDGGPNDPEWVMLEGQPDGVELFVARHPERVVSVEWDSCGEGCLSGRSTVQCAWIAGYVDETRRVAWVQMPLELQVAALIDIETGRAIAAWKLWDVEEPTGQLGAPAYGGDRVAISAYANRPSGLTQLSAWTAPVGETATVVAPVYQFDVMSSLTIVENHVSATHRAWTYSPTATLALMDETGERAFFPPRGTDGTIVHTDLIGDRVFYELWTDHARVWTGTVAEPPSVLIDASPGEVRRFATDGNNLVWLQGYDYDFATRTFARLELWTSPYATRVEDVVPTRVSDFPGLYRPAYGAHWLAAVYVDRVMAVWDTRDGSRREWDPPDDGNVVDVPLYATDEEILVIATTGIFRIDPNVLPIVEP
ncbi:MAG: hypothetical protein U0271_48790 [Polyangiaceae bacterium]